MNSTKRTTEQIVELESRLLSRRRGRIRAAFARAMFFVLYLLSIAAGRLFELLVSAAIVVFGTLPVLVVLILRKIVFGRDIFIEQTVYGRRAKALRIRYFNLNRYYLRNLSLFFHVFTNQLGLTGVSMKTYSARHRVIGDSYLFNNKPGIFNLWYVKQSSRIGHKGIFDVEWEYAFRRRIISDMMLVFKSIPAALYYQDTAEHSNTVNIFGLEFDNVMMNDAVRIVRNAIADVSKTTVFFVNPDCLNKIFVDTDYYRALKTSDYIFPDGIGINIACKILRDPLVENVNGTDLLPFLCEMCQEEGLSIYLLGAEPGIAEKMKDRLEEKYPGLRIAGAVHGFFDREMQSREVIEGINSARPDILLVAFGAPHQEKWLSRHKDEINAKVMMGVGGLFDFYAETIKRAPVWMREMGIEWIFRLIQEPGRMWRRYVIGNPLFIYRVLKWKMAQQR